MSIDGEIISGVRWIRNAIGRVIGYRNPVTDHDEASPFVPVALTADEIASPTPAILADLDATYRLDVAPYTRYQSNGVALVALGGDGSGGELIAANNLSDVANADTARTNLGLALGVNVQAFNAKLSEFSAANTPGVVANIDGTDMEIVPLGVANASDIPRRSHGDARWLRWFTSLPAAGVGADGDYGVLYANGYPAVLINKVAGAWVIIDATLTHAQMMAIASPAVGMTVPVSTIDLGGTAGVVPINTNFSWDGTYWRPLRDVRLWGAAGANTITNSQTAFQAALSMAPPAGLVSPGSELITYVFVIPSGAGTATYTPQIFANGAQIATYQGAVATGSTARGSSWLWSDTANRLEGGVGGTGMDDFSASTTASTLAMAASFNGAITLQVGSTFSATGTDKTLTFERISMVLRP